MDKAEKRMKKTAAVTQPKLFPKLLVPGEQWRSWQSRDSLPEAYSARARG